MLYLEMLLKMELKINRSTVKECNYLPFSVISLNLAFTYKLAIPIILSITSAVYCYRYTSCQLFNNFCAKIQTVQCRASSSLFVTEMWCLPRNVIPAFSLPSLSIVLLPSPSIVSSIGRHYTHMVVCVQPETAPIMHTFLSVTLAHTIQRLHVSARNNWIPKCEGYIHTYKLFPRCDVGLVASR